VNPPKRARSLVRGLLSNLQFQPEKALASGGQQVQVCFPEGSVRTIAPSPTFLAYSWAEMVFCSHCGKLAEGGRFCSACGEPITPDAVKAMSAELRRHRKEMRLIVVALGLVFAVAAGLIVSRGRHAERIVDRSLSGSETAAPALPQQQPLPAQTPPGQAIPPNTITSQPQQQPTQLIAPNEEHPASRPSTGSIDPKAVQNALTTLAPSGKQKDPSTQRQPASSPSGSDRYPGSQPVEVKNADLPDIGIPVASDVYTTSDSIPTVISYYTQRYPDAEVMEVSGQKIIAVNRPGATKVIAIGTAGAETRIAIVQPRN
jgi:hypothetical protein